MVEMPGVMRSIANFERVIAWSREQESRIGYFAALYLGVTKAMVAPVAGTSPVMFDDPERLDRFVDTFAQRYFDAFDHRNELSPGHPWAVHFAHCEGARSTILQILTSGANAHMNLDLSMAALEIAGDDLDALHGDFLRINQVLGAQIDKGQEQVLSLSPTMRLASRWPRFSAWIVGFSIETARDYAWKNATQINEQLDGLSGPSIDTEQELAELVGRHGRRIVSPPLPLRLALSYGAAPFEESDVNKVIDRFLRADPSVYIGV